MVYRRRECVGARIDYAETESPGHTAGRRSQCEEEERTGGKVKRLEETGMETAPLHRCYSSPPPGAVNTWRSSGSGDHAVQGWRCEEVCESERISRRTAGTQRPERRPGVADPSWPAV